MNFYKIMQKAFLWLLLLLSPLLYGQDNADINKVVIELKQYIKNTMPESATPGMAIVIVHDDKIVFCEGFGNKVFGKNDPIDPHTIFQGACLTKNFTASLLGILQEKKLINLDDLVKKYLPNFQLSDPEVTAQITLRDIISQRSGIQHFASDEMWVLGYEPHEVISTLAYTPFMGPFRETYSYQNILFAVIGPAIEQALQQDFADLVRNYLLEPMNMKECDIGDSNKKNWWQKIIVFIKRLFKFGEFSNVAQPHTIDKNNNPVPIDFDDRMFKFPASTGLKISAHDLGQWILLQLNQGVYQGKQIIPLEHIKQMRKYHVKGMFKGKNMQFATERFFDVGYGMGWFIHKYGEKNKKMVDALTQMGGIFGMRSLVTILPKEKIGIGILANIGGMKASLYPEAIRYKFLDLYLKLSNIDWSTVILNNEREKKITAEKNFTSQLLDINHQKMADISHYLGTYENHLCGKFSISAQKDILSLNFRNKTLKLTHLAGNIFTFDQTILSNTFLSDETGLLIFYVDNNTKQKKCYLNLLKKFDGGNFVFIE